MMNYIFSACAVALSVFCLVYTTKNKVNRRSQRFVFNLLLLNLCVATSFDIAGNFIQRQAPLSTEFYYLRIVCSYIFFMIHNTLSCGYTLYLINVNGIGIGRKKFFYFLLLLPMIVAETLIVTNPFTEALFYFDRAGVYHRGDYMVMLYLTSFIYLFISFYYMIKYRKALSHGENIMLLYFFTLTILGIGIQALYFKLQVEAFCEMLAMLAVMLTLEDEDRDIDTASGAYNRGAFISENRRLIQTGHEYSVISLNFMNLRFFFRMLHYEEQSDLLHMIASWLGSCAPGLSVYRLSDTNFTLIYLNRDHESLEELADKIKDRLNSGWMYKKAQLDFNVLMRIARVPADVTDPELMTELADESDHIEKSGVSVQRGSDLYFLARRVQVEAALRDAINNNRFEVYYQPIWLAGTGKIYSAEALLRLTDPELGFLPPDEIIPIAERNGLIGEIGRIVFDNVCRFVGSEEYKSLGLKYVEVNLSIYQLILANTKEQFEKSMKQYNVTSDQINLEITETASLSAASTVSASINELKNAGFRFSLDDYGTGYSNLTYVIDMDFLNIKSDKGLLWASDNDVNSRHLLMDSIRMMRRLGMNVIQEGVETSEQLDLVLDAGANLIQGYYFSKPLREKEFVDFVRKFNEHPKRF
ncbi:MAG: EAL domain-containing protein [Lachnospiraceae bacterium]|nr:EAL domain-containing protein [Lachnospiraceae bacterium]